MTHNSTKEEKARSRHEIMVVTQIPGNKKMWSQQESSLLETKRGHDKTKESRNSRDKEFMSRPLTEENSKERCHDRGYQFTTQD